MTRRRGSKDTYVRPRFNDVQIAEQQRWCYQQRLDGVMLHEIAEAFERYFHAKVSVATIKGRIDAECAARVDPAAAEQYRQIAIERAEEQLKRLRQALRWSGDHHKVEANLLRTLDHLAKLQGTYAPERVDISITTVGSVDDELNELAAQLGLNDAPDSPAVLTDADA